MSEYTALTSANFENPPVIINVFMESQSPTVISLPFLQRIISYYKLYLEKEKKILPGLSTMAQWLKSSP